MLMFMNCRQYLGARASPGGNLPLRDRSHWAQGTGGYQGGRCCPHQQGYCAINSGFSSRLNLCPQLQMP